MTEYLITPLLPGTTRAEIVQFFNNKEHPFHVSSAVDEITGFMHDFEASTAVCSNQSFPLETKRPTAEHGIIKGPQRLVAGQDIGGQSMCSGPEPLVIQRASNLFRTVGGSSVGCNSSLLQREPRALNAVDILRETASEGPPSIVDSPGIPNALDCVVKKEEGPENANPLFTQDPPRPQPTQSLFSRGTHAEVLMEEDATVVTERHVKEEVADEQFDDPEDREEEDGEKTKGAHQAIAGSSSSGRPWCTQEQTVKLGVDREIKTEEVEQEPEIVFKTEIAFKPEIADTLEAEDPPRPQPTQSLFSRGTHAEALMEEDATERLIKDEVDDEQFDDTEDREEEGGEKTKGAHQDASDLTLNGLQDGGRFKCIVCNDVFSSHSLFLRHIPSHTKCKMPDKRIIGHSGTNQCEICGKRLSTKRGLMDHLRIHTGEKPYECAVCQKRLASKTSLTRHFRDHTGEKPFECTACDKKFTWKGDLTKHFRMHTGERPYKCTECQMRFTHSGNLLRHRRSCHGFEKPSDCRQRYLV